MRGAESNKRSQSRVWAAFCGKATDNRHAADWGEQGMAAKSLKGSNQTISAEGAPVTSTPDALSAQVISTPQLGLGPPRDCVVGERVF